MFIGATNVNATRLNEIRNQAGGEEADEEIQGGEVSEACLKHWQDEMREEGDGSDKDGDPIQQVQAWIEDIETKIKYNHSLIKSIVRNTREQNVKEVDRAIIKFSLHLQDVEEKFAFDKEFNPFYDYQTVCVEQPFEPSYNLYGMDYLQAWIFEFVHNTHWNLWADIFGSIVLLGIIVSIVASTMESYPQFTKHPVLLQIEMYTTLLFTVELALRAWGVGPGKSIKYWTSVINLLDVFATLPFYVEMILIAVVGETEIGINSVFRIVRLTRLTRLRAIRTHYLPIIMKTLSLFVVEVLSSIVVIITIAIILFANMIIFVETDLPESIYNKDSGNPALHSIPDGLWWSLITMTTVGYGDKYPNSELGYLVTFMVAFIGIIITALMLMVVGEMYSKAMVDFDREIIRITKVFVNAKIIKSAYGKVPKGTSMDELYTRYMAYVSKINPNAGQRIQSVRDSQINPDIGRSDTADISRSIKEGNEEFEPDESKFVDAENSLVVGDEDNEIPDDVVEKVDPDQEENQMNTMDEDTNNEIEANQEIGDVETGDATTAGINPFGDDA